MRAEASSGRSDFVSSAFSKVDSPTAAGAVTLSIARRAVLGHRRERRDAHRDDLLGFRRLHRLDGVAGIDRPLERVGGDDLGDVGDLHHVERGGDARGDVLARRRRRRDERRRSCRSASAMSAAVSSASPCSRCGASASSTLLTPDELGGRFGGGLGVVAGDEHVDVAAQRLGRGDGLAGRGLQRAVGVLGQQENRHQSTPASALSFCTSSATLPTLTPALRLAGSAIFSTLRRGVDVDAELVGLLDVERLLLRLHDVGQRGIARLVEAQVGGDDRRQLEAHGLEAAVDLARDDGAAVVDRRAWKRRCPAASRAARPASGRSDCSRRRWPACRG